MSNEIEFRVAYVTSGEICRRVRITPAALSIALKAGKFPKPLALDERTNIWKRDEVEDHIEAWAADLLARRNK